MPTPLLRGHVPGMGDSMPSERRAGHATLDEQGSPQNLGTPFFAGWHGHPPYRSVLKSLVAPAWLLVAFPPTDRV
jgi:hypothetical protein